MAIPVLIIGKSGSGKSASMRNFDSKKIGIINVMNKPLPFKSDIKCVVSKSYDEITNILDKAKADSVVIDDAGYLITDMFMRGHSNNSGGNSMYAFYNDIGDRFYNLIQHIIQKMPANKIVYVVMHEERNDFGEVKPKTIGKLLDEKVCVEGLFTIVLHAVTDGVNYVFEVKSDGRNVAKTPIGMFDKQYIDNDLAVVDAAIRKYYNLGVKEE